MYADIIVDITHAKLDRVFQYQIPSEMEGVLKPGMEVCVPFGNGNKETKGYVTGITDTCDYDPSKIKKIKKIQEGSVQIESKLIELAAWMKENYGGTMIQALKTVLPIKQKQKSKLKRTVKLLLSEEEGKEKLDLYLHKNQKARARVLAELLTYKELEYELIVKKLNVSSSVLKALEEQKVLVIDKEQIYRNPVKEKKKEQKEIQYTKEQEEAVLRFTDDYKKGIRNIYLIHGVTGSGKTEVYMEMIAHVLEQGKQAIVLIPEIALTYQTVMRFYDRFGNRVSIMNSRLSPGERYDQMMRAKKGEIDVMIGPRSALFTPFLNLGLIVIDEEHESTYKSEQVPCFHARETAIARAQIENASVVLGSATPSVDAYYHAQCKEYVLLRLKERAGKQSLPTVYTVDMREELKKGNRSILSDRLYEMIKDRLNKKEQIMLFINRRGYAGFISCRSCGYVAKCPHCDVALSAHKNGKLVCHYCGYEEKQFAKCPKCGSKYIGGFRAGTQQIEELVKNTFKEAKVLRMDMDTTKSKHGHENILSSFANGEADILIGTQMIVKGHDFPNVTLVGILAADLSLYADDYRAGERTFQLLTQAAGRAGRGKKEGEVVIQTYSPEHYCVELAAKQDYEQFYEKEIDYRDLMGYPPVEQMLVILVSCEEEGYLDQAAFYLKEYADRLNQGGKFQIIGPASPYVGKINDIYRKIIYIKHENYDMLISMKDKLEKYIKVNEGFNKTRIQFDFNPMNIF